MEVNDSAYKSLTFLEKHFTKDEIIGYHQQLNAEYPNGIKFDISPLTDVSVEQLKSIMY